MNVVSLLPSATEIVWELGCGDRLVGRSHECDFPPEVNALPACTEPKLDPDGTSYEIQERVKAIVQEGLGVYRVDLERLRELEPGLIITQEQCEVCAVSSEHLEELVREALDPSPEILSLDPTDLEWALADVERVAEALGVPRRGRALTDRIMDEMEAIGRKARAPGTPTPSVALIEWLDPLMAAGNWMPELVRLAGGDPVFGEAGEHSGWLEWEELVEADPEVIVVVPCGFTVGRTRQELGALTEREGWDRLAAVRTERVYLADGHSFFNRPGPRLVESLEILAEVLHPELFGFGHEGSGWVPA